MKTTDNVTEGNGNVENLPGTGSSPETAADNPGVTYGIGIPDAAGNKNSTDNDTGKDNKKKWYFSNERPIY